MDSKSIFEKVDKKIFELSPEAIVVLGKSGKVLQINNRAYEWLGYKPEELVGKSVFTLPFFSVESKAKVLKNFTRRIAGKEVPAYESEFITKDGKKKIGKIDAALVRDEQGKIIADLVMVSDVSEQYFANNALRLQKERTRQYLDLVGVVVIVIGLDGKVQLINKKGVRLLGYENDTQIVGLNWFDSFIHESIREEMKGHFNEIVKGNLKGRGRIENPVVTHSGKQRIISWHNSYLKDESGEIIASVSSGEDVTDIREAEKELKRRTRETEQMNALMVGREIKMVELKKRVRELEVMTGREGKR